MSLVVNSNPVGPNLDWCIRKLRFSDPFPHHTRLISKVTEVAKRIIYFIAALLLVPFVAIHYWTYWMISCFVARAGHCSLSTQQNSPKSAELLGQAELEKRPVHRIVDQSARPFKMGGKTVVLLSDVHNNENYKKCNSNFVDEWIRDSDLMFTEIVNNNKDLSGMSRKSLLQMTPHVSHEKKFTIKGWDSKSKFIHSCFFYREVCPVLDLVGDIHKFFSEGKKGVRSTIVNDVLLLLNKVTQQIDDCVLEITFSKGFCRSLEIKSILSQLRDKLNEIADFGVNFVNESSEVLKGHLDDAREICARLLPEGWRQIVQESSKRNRSLVDSLRSSLSDSEPDRRIFLIAGRGHILQCCASKVKLEVDEKEKKHVCGVELAPHIREFIDEECKPKNVEWIVLDVNQAS
jgi:hypothetical protein